MGTLETEDAPSPSCFGDEKDQRKPLAGDQVQAGEWHLWPGVWGQRKRGPGSWPEQLLCARPGSGPEGHGSDGKTEIPALLALVF